MARPELIEDGSEQKLENWLSAIEARWQSIPEFKVDPEKLKHLAVICDGNRRAARERDFHSWEGHQAGVEVIKGIARAGRRWGIHTLTFWTWSTENWERDERQVEFVMGLAARNLVDEEIINELVENEVRFTHLGRKDRLPSVVKKAIESLEAQTADFDHYRLNLAIDYGGLDETARGIQRMFKAFQEGEFNPEMLKEIPQAILGFLDTADQVLPDLVIRTGVKEEEIPHISGFMPLQTTYSGWLFLPDLFPDLTPQTFLQPIKKFLDYERRMGR